jgi:uncharacterized protein YaiI (UPF0178 family)
MKAVMAKPTLFIDADACPVKDEAYKVAARYGVKTFVVANAFLQVPQTPAIERVVVDAGPDIADDWIAERAQALDVVVTNDIPLADRVLKKGASAVAPNGRRFTPDSIGSALAGRAIGEHLRSMGEVTRGPAAFDRNARSKFLQTLDEVLSKAVRGRP